MEPTAVPVVQVWLTPHLPDRRPRGSSGGSLCTTMNECESLLNETVTIIIIAATFLLSGSVKGVIGLGLPTVSLAATGRCP